MQTYILPKLGRRGEIWKQHKSNFTGCTVQKQYWINTFLSPKLSCRTNGS